MLEPVGQFLNGDKVRIEIDHVHRAEIARGVVINNPVRIEVFHNRLGAQRKFGVPARPLIARVVKSINHVRIHVLLVPGRVVAHRVGDNGRMILRHADIELRVTRVTVGLVGVRGFPIVMAEVRLRQCDEHSNIVRGAQDFLEAEMRTRLAAIIVRIDEVDSDALEPLQAFPCAIVSRQRSAHLRVVQRDGA